MALPVDVWRVVAGHLVTERDLCALACVSRELRGAVDDDAVWRRLFNRRYELEFLMSPSSSVTSPQDRKSVV